MGKGLNEKTCGFEANDNRTSRFGGCTLLLVQRQIFYALRLFSALVRARTAPRAAGAWGAEAAAGVRWDAGWAVLSARRPGTATSLAAATAGRAAAACGT